MRARGQRRTGWGHSELHPGLLWDCFSSNSSQTIPHFLSGCLFQKQVVILVTRTHPETSGGRLIFRRQQQMGLVPVEN